MGRQSLRVTMDARDPWPTQDLHGRVALAPVFDALNAYISAIHFNGRSTVEPDGTRMLTVASFRCLDIFVKQDGGCPPGAA